MTRKDRISENISDLLPDSSSLLGTDGLEARQALVEKKATNIHERKSARELARARFIIRTNQEAAVADQAVAEYIEEKEQAKEEAIKQLEDESPYITAEEAIEIGNEEARKHNLPQISLASDTAKALMATQGTTRPEVVRLLTQLNVNLNLQLTKTDTANLLACLLTANENQLKAIYKNKKVPVAVKTVINEVIKIEAGVFQSDTFFILLNSFNNMISNLSLVILIKSVCIFSLSLTMNFSFSYLEPIY